MNGQSQAPPSLVRVVLPVPRSLLSVHCRPYGVQAESRGTSPDQPYAWTGREHDPETGFYFLRARYYDPTLGRFTQEDPIGEAGGSNLYAYVEGQPLEQTDPSGMISEWTPDASYYAHLRYFAETEARMNFWEAYLMAMPTGASRGAVAVLADGRRVPCSRLGNVCERFIDRSQGSGRGLSLGEQMALGKFCLVVRCGSVRLHEMAFMPKNAAMTIGYHIMFNPSQVQAPPIDLLAHEMTHVWQYENMGPLRNLVYLAVGLVATIKHHLLGIGMRTDGSYHWQPGSGFGEYGFEQQAQIVGECFNPTAVLHSDACALSPFHP